MSNILKTALNGAKDGFGKAAANVAIEHGIPAVERALEDSEVQDGAIKAISEKVQEGVTEAVGNIKNNFKEVTNHVATAFNPENRGLWATIREGVVGNTTGLARFFRLGLGAILWTGATLGSYVGVGMVRISGLNPDASVQETSQNFRQTLGGLLGRLFGIDMRFEEDEINKAADLVTGHQPTQTTPAAAG